MGGLRRFILTTSLAACPAAPVASCPVCDRETGREVRAGISGPDFAFNLLAAGLPFGILLGVAAAIHLGFPRGRSRPAARGGDA